MNAAIAFALSAVPASWVTATVDALDTYREGIYGESSPGITRKIVLGASIVAAIWLGLYAWDRYQRKRRAADESARSSLWGELSAAHGLSAAERQALERLSAEASLDPPESIFATPEVLEARLAAEPGSAQWTRLTRKLFGEPA